MAAGVAGCKSKTAAAPIVSVADGAAADGTASGDPAAGNLAVPYTGGTSGGYSAGGAGKTRVLGQSQAFAGQSSGENYSGGGYPQGRAQEASQGSPQGYSEGLQSGYDPNAGGYYDPNAGGSDDAEYAGEQAVEEANVAPPQLPEYDQPPAPEQNDIWTPGYWNYQNTGYYWVPGVWCAPPFYGALWTPPWWGSYGSGYRFHHGYWGPHVGYYGGVNYGFGYIGTGYFGGYWRNRDFVYNRSVTNVNINVIHNVYERQVVYEGRQYGPHPTDRVSYNGGRGGINLQPRPFELAAAHEAHYAPVAAQRDVRVAAASNRGQFAAANNGRPAEAFASRPAGNTMSISGAPQGQPFNRPGGSPSARLGGVDRAQPRQAPNRGVPGAIPAENEQRAGGFTGQRNGQRQEQPTQVINGGQLAPGERVSGSREGNQGVLNGSRGTLPGQPARTGGAVVPPVQGRVLTPQPGSQPAPQSPQQRGTQPGNGGQFYNHHQSPQGYGQQRATESVRPVPQSEVSRPNPQVQQPNVQQPRPQFQQGRPAPQAEQPRPQFQQRAEPAPEARPQMAAPQSAPRPAPAQAPHAVPAPGGAPHGGSGEGEHGGHPR